MVVLSTSLDRSNQRLMIEFACGAIIGIPLSRIHTVRKLTDMELASVTPTPDGDGIEWRSAGIRIGVAVLRDAIFAGKAEREQAA